jgi:hypothetical protein
MLVVNTVGILEIIYIFLVARKYNVETMDDSERNVPQAPGNVGTGTPDADFDEPSIPSRDNSVSSSEMTSISQIIKTVETKNTIVPPKKELMKEEPKVESSLEK